MTAQRDEERPAQESPQNRRVFNPDMLRTARGARGLTQNEFAALVGVKQHAVSRWEDGLRIPSDEDVQKIADTLGRTVQFFYQADRPCGIDIAFMYRKRKRTPVTLVRQIQDRINIILIGLRRAIRNVESWPIRFEQMDVEDERYEGAEHIAKLTRAVWQVPFGPVPDLVSLIESAGGIVFPMDFGTDDVDAVGLWPWDMPPMFFLNPSAPAERARFSLAHELGHIIMHRIPTPDMEDEADQFASELLMPMRDVAVEFAGLTFQRAVRLKLRWRVSAQAIIRKAKDIGAIPEGRYRSMNVYISQNGYRKQEPNPIAGERPTTVDRLLKSVHIGQLGYEVPELARAMFYANEGEFRREILREPGSESGPFRIIG